MVGQVVNQALGIVGGDLPTTQDMGQWLAARGAVPGIGGPGDISVGWYNHGSAPNDGHAAMTLSNGLNAESGGPNGRFVVGPGAAGASSAEFDQHMFLPGAGRAGGYQVDSKRVADLEERIRRKDQSIQDLEERQAELKDTAKKSERDRLQHKIDLNKLKGELGQAEQGTFRPASRGRSGRSGYGGGGMSGGLGAPLPANFGHNKGLAGVAEWGVDALMNIAAAPALATMDALSGGATGPGGTTGLFGMAAANGAFPGLFGTRPGGMGPRPLGGGLGPLLGGGIAGATPGDVTGYQGTATPLDALGTPKQMEGTGQGIGMSGGGLLGAAMGAASGGGGLALNAMAPGAGSAAQIGMQIGMQELSRGIQYGGQMAGLGVDAIQQTLFPDMPMNGPLAKALGGLAGGHPVMADTADQQQQGQGGYQDGKGPDAGATPGPGGGAMTGSSADPLKPGQGGDTTNNNQQSGDTVHGNQINGDVHITQGSQDPSGMFGFAQTPATAGMLP